MENFPKELLKIDPFELACDIALSSKITDMALLGAIIQAELKQYAPAVGKRDWWYRAGEGCAKGYIERIKKNA